MRLATALNVALGSSLSALDLVIAASSPAESVRYSCEPCLDRSDYSVKAVVHGTATDPFWQQVRSTAVQSASDMGVTLEMDLSNSFDTETMVRDIGAAVDAHGSSGGYDALVVTIPSISVLDAVDQAVKAGVPVFGLNSGDPSQAKSVGVLDFVASDNKKGGEMAAEEMQKFFSSGRFENALFVNDEYGNTAINERLEGFKEKLGDSVEVTELSVDGTSSSDMNSKLEGALDDCSSYQAVLLSGTRALQAAVAAYNSAGCSLSNIPLGAFDTSKEVFDAISSEELAFTVGQQQALQGALSVHMAALYASTGKTLALPMDGAYLSGPHLITKETLPTDPKRICEDEAFPVCPDTAAPDGSEPQCACIERSTIKIGGVTHGHTTDSFWDPVYTASAQAAQDMGVELFNERFSKPEDGTPKEQEALLHTMMANKIKNLCEDEQVDGLFVSIPSEAVVSAIEDCMDLGIPVMSINAGASTSETMGLMHHVGQLEYNAGFGAGEFLANRGITKAICVNHAIGVSVVEERCDGFQAAIEKEGIEYWGQVYVEDNKRQEYIEDVESLVANKTGTSEGDWEGIGILAAGGPQHIPVIALQARHKKSVIGAFDTSSDLYEAVDIGIKEFGIDQQPYLQGYMPVMLLTHRASNGQFLSNQVIESGPAFVTASPSDAQVKCEEIAFQTCEEGEGTRSGGKGGKPNTGFIVSLLLAAISMVVANF